MNDQQEEIKGLSHIHILARQVGNTPLLYFPSLSNDNVRVYGKAEWMQIGQSVKARAAYNIIKRALINGWLDKKILLDASSGNTAIAYAAIAAKLNIPLEICLPANASEKRKLMLEALGAKLHLTSELEGTDGAQEAARKLSDNHPEKYYYADQYNNDANWQAHVSGTAKEILQQTNNEVTHFVTGLGTSGSFVGTSLGLKGHDRGIRTVALQPDSPMHFLEGWKHMPTARTPGILDTSNIDEEIEISSMKAVEMVKKIARDEGMLISPSSAANLIGASQVAGRIDEGVVVTLLPDDLSKYDEVYKMILS